MVRPRSKGSPWPREWQVAGLGGGQVRRTPCTFEFDLLASPGLGILESSGTFTTNGETGTVACDGPVNGSQATGAGSVGTDLRYGTNGGDSCLSGGEFEGVTRSRSPPLGEASTRPAPSLVPTTVRPGPAARFRGEFHSERASGTFESTPVEGDCLTKPVTKFYVKVKGMCRW